MSCRWRARVPPDIVVEVVSREPADQDGLVSPELRAIEILELGSDGRDVHAQNDTTGSRAVVGCDGLVIDGGDLWREVERVEAVGS